MFFLFVLIIKLLFTYAEINEEFNNNYVAPELLRYNRYDEVILYLKKLQKLYPENISINSIGTTYEGRDILAVKVSGNIREKNRPIILIEAGIHAREWMTTAVALNLINQLIFNKYMIDKVNWIIIPLLNPDGYEYTHTKDRLWRKNRSKGKNCDGVDINRNFGFHWGEHGSSKNECSLNYAGPKPFSEPETRAIRDLALRFRKNIKLYIGLHTYGEQILFPWGYSQRLVSKKFEEEHYNLGSIVSLAISNYRGSNYEVGHLGSALYLASGISNDWMAGVAKIPLCYIIELNNDKLGFTPPKEEILPTARELFNGFKIFHMYVEMDMLNKFNTIQKRRKKSRNKKNGNLYV